MYGPKLSTVFASRWKALWWAAGVLFTAWTLVPAAEDTPAPEQPKAAHFDPWAKTPAADQK